MLLQVIFNLFFTLLTANIEQFYQLLISQKSITVRIFDQTIGEESSKMQLFWDKWLF